MKLVPFKFPFIYLVPPEISAEEVVRDEPEDLDTDDHIWSWQEEFKQVVSKLALAISDNIQSEMKSALQNEMKDYEKSHVHYEDVSVSGKFCRFRSNFLRYRIIILIPFL